MKFIRLGIGLLVLVSGVTGCSDGIERFPVAIVTGKVMCQGMPVEKAQIFFEPIRSRATGPKDETSSKIGKIGYALTDATGEFKVSTYGEGDGAVIGHHKVRVGAPSSSEFKCECYCNANKPLMEVDVVEGKANEFTLTLRLPTADEAAKSASSDETE